MQDKLKLIFWIMNLGLIFCCLAPVGDHVPQPFARSDLMYHGMAFFSVGIISKLAFYQRRFVISLIFLEGILIEVIQPYFGRYFEKWDILANGLGLLLAWILAKKIHRPLKKYL